METLLGILIWCFIAIGVIIEIEMPESKLKSNLIYLTLLLILVVIVIIVIIQ